MRLSNTMLAIFVLFFTISLTLGSLTIINKLENYQLQLTGKSTAGQISLNVGLPEQVAAPTPVPTPASGGAGGGGGGRGSKGGATINPDFEVTPTHIHILSKQGQFQRANVVVTNIGSVYLTFKAKIVGLEEFISLDKNDFALPTKESETLVLDIKIPKNKEPDVYTGYLLVETPSVSKKVPIILEVESKKILFDIMTIIPEEYKAIDPGADAWAKITIFNFIGLPKEAELTYGIKDLNDNVINEKKEIIKISEGISFLRSLNVGSALEGDYVFYSKISFQSYTAVSGDLFGIVAKKVEIPFRIPEKYLTLIQLLSLAIIIALLILFNVLYLHHRRKLKKLQTSHRKKLEEIEKTHKDEMEKMYRELDKKKIFKKEE